MIDDSYIDGISVTASLHVNTSGDLLVLQLILVTLHIIVPTYSGVIPLFIGNNWFCEASGFDNWQRRTIYCDNPLWDGTGC